jgi:hypothetical protein
MTALLRSTCFAALMVATVGQGAISIPDEVALGTLSPELHEILIPVMNSGPETTITQADADCDCLTIEATPVLLPARSNSLIHAKLDLRKKRGRMARLVVLQTGGERYLTAITTTVSSSKNWRFEDTVKIAAASTAANGVVVRFDRAGGRTASLVAVEPSVPWVTATLHPTANGADIAYRLGPIVPDGETQVPVTVRTDDLEEPVVTQILQVDGGKKFRLDPATPAVAAARIGQRLVVTILAANWDSPEAPVFLVDGKAAEVLGSEELTGGPRLWRIGFVPDTAGMTEKRIRIFRPDRTTPREDVCQAELSLVIKVLH